MKRVVWAVVALVAVVGVSVAYAAPWGDATAQQSQTTVTVYDMTGSGGAAGGECIPEGVVNPDRPEPWRQVIITSDTGTIVGYIDIRDGEVADVGGNGDLRCAVIANVTLEASPFYTFTIDGVYRRTISADALAELGEGIFIPLFPS